MEITQDYSESDFELHNYYQRSLRDLSFCNLSEIHAQISFDIKKGRFSYLEFIWHHWELWEFEVIQNYAPQIYFEH